MSKISDAFAAGDLPGALAAAVAEVRAKPREPGLRWLMAEMLLFSGEIDRADKALDAVLEDTPAPTIMEFRHLLRGETARRQVFADGRAPKFQGEDATPAQAAALRALAEARAGDAATASASAAEAEALRVRCGGTVERGDGTTFTFDDLRDVDDLLAPTLEVITAAGDYMWVPFERIGSLEFDAAKRPRDLYWRRCAITLKDGTEGVVYVPVTYPWSGTAPAAPLLLGRETDWVGDGGAAGPVRGVGQRLLLAGDEALAITEAVMIGFA